MEHALQLSHAYTCIYDIKFDLLAKVSMHVHDIILFRLGIIEHTLGLVHVHVAYLVSSMLPYNYMHVSVVI